MAAIIFPQAMPPQPVATQTVSMRSTWDSPWVPVDQLHCTQLALATGESLSAASFVRGVGQYLPPNSSVWTSQSVLSINPQTYVRVQVTGSAGRAGYDWFGIWRRAELHARRQRFDAVGVEQLLDVPCKDAPWLHGSTVRYALRGLEFNRGGLPDRSAAKKLVNGVDCYVWEPLLGAGEYWSTRDAVETLLALAAPKDDAGAVLWNWGLSNIEALPDFDQVKLPTHGRTYLDLLRTLVPRHRLIGWTCEPGAVDPQIRFFTFAEAAVTLLDVAGAAIGTIPANAATDTLALQYDSGGASSFVTEASHVADQVVVSGDRRQVVFTLSKMDLTLDMLWTLAEQAAYKAAASGEPDYPALPDRRGQQERDADFRAGDRYRHVFAEWNPPISWIQAAGDGEGVEAKLPIVVDDDDNQVWQYRPAIEFLERLPLLSGYDYRDDEIATANAADPVPTHRAKDLDASRTEPLPLLGFARVWVDPEPVDPAPDRWAQIDQIGRCADLEQLDGGINRRWSATVRPIRGTLSVEIRVQGEQQHVLGGFEFLLHRDRVYGSVNWQEDLIITVAIEETRDLSIAYPADADVTPIGERVRIRRLEAPGFYRADVRPNTVVGVDPKTGLLLRTNAGGTIHDDSDELKLLAQRLYQWQKVPRYAVGVSSTWIDGRLLIGRLLTALADVNGSSVVNTVVTEITLEFPVTDGPRPQPPRATLATAFAELDPQRIV